MLSQPDHKSQSSQAHLSSFLSEQLKAVDECIIQKMHSPVSLIPQIAQYLISLGGKRLRPLLTLASAELCGYQGKRHISLAACVEFIHTATLLHDDVVDESSLRRGNKTANMLWDRKSCILVGDFLFSRALEMMVEDGSQDILEILSNASTTITEGEVLQLTASHDLNLSKETYLKIIEAKTACLFAAAAEIGAIAGDANLSQRKALREYGLNLGMAFQLMDDVLDYSADQEKLGKTVGDDFREGKVTLPIIIAYQLGGDKTFWLQAFNKEQSNGKELRTAISLLQNTGALQKTKQVAQGYVQKALNCLDVFPNSDLKTCLMDLASFSVCRES